MLSLVRPLNQPFGDIMPVHVVGTVGEERSVISGGVQTGAFESEIPANQARMRAKAI